MRNIIFVCIALLVWGCSSRPKYPRFVHNKCSGVWAIISGYGKPADIFDDWYVTGKKPQKEQDLYFGIINNATLTFNGFSSIPDTISNVPLGHELTFSDSISADKYYHRIVLVKQQAIAEEERKRKAVDSIWKCQHSYQ